MDVAVLLNRLMDQGMKLSLKKLKVSRQVTFGGFKLETSVQGVRMMVDETRIEALMNVLEPQDAKDSQYFLGLIRTFCAWLPTISSSTTVLRELAKELMQW